MFRKHFKRSLQTGKNAIPAYIKDSPRGTSPLLKKELTLVILRHDSEESTFAKAVSRQKEIVEKYSRHTLKPDFPEMKDTFQIFPDEKFKLLGNSILKRAGLSNSELRKHLNFNKSTTARANRKVATAKSVLPDMWKTAFLPYGAFSLPWTI